MCGSISSIGSGSSSLEQSVADGMPQAALRRKDSDEGLLVGVVGSS